MAKSPRERPPTAEALQLELEEMARDARLAISSVTLIRLMESLFGKGVRAWHDAIAQHDEKALVAHIIHSYGSLPTEPALHDTDVDTVLPEAREPSWRTSGELPAHHRRSGTQQLWLMLTQPLALVALVSAALVLGLGSAIHRALSADGLSAPLLRDRPLAAGLAGTPAIDWPWQEAGRFTFTGEPGQYSERLHPRRATHFKLVVATECAPAIVSLKATTDADGVVPVAFLGQVFTEDGERIEAVYELQTPRHAATKLTGLMLGMTSRSGAPCPVSVYATEQP
jgi:hypothetical protein